MSRGRTRGSRPLWPAANTGADAKAPGAGTSAGALAGAVAWVLLGPSGLLCHSTMAARCGHQAEEQLSLAPGPAQTLPQCK